MISILIGILIAFLKQPETFFTSYEEEEVDDESSYDSIN
jgi:hypothetical protein